MPIVLTDFADSHKNPKEKQEEKNNYNACLIFAAQRQFVCFWQFDCSRTITEFKIT